MQTILVLNAGSSSVKFQLFEAAADGPSRLLRGQIEQIGLAPRFKARDAGGATVAERTFATDDLPDTDAALWMLAGWLRDERQVNPVAVGHRVVHGGPDYAAPVRIDRQVLERLEQLSPLAILHQPANLTPIRALLQRRPELPQIACFDTAFHRGHGPVADHYAIPEPLYAEGVRRYGFHGLSYEFIANHLRASAPAIARGRVIVAHLGSGASMCAMLDGKSVESTMGFTALDGLPMGTRPGQIDPGVVLHLMRAKSMTTEQVEDFLYRQCGLKGLSGISNDLRDLLQSPDPRARLAIDYFNHRAGLAGGMLAAALGGLDGLVFTAGIGENAPLIRARIAGYLSFLGVRLNAKANAENATVISSPDSLVKVMVIPTDEELMIARHTVAALGLVGKP